jgi:hypothetical protein
MAHANSVEMHERIQCDTLPSAIRAHERVCYHGGIDTISQQSPAHADTRWMFPLPTGSQAIWKAPDQVDTAPLAVCQRPRPSKRRTESGSEDELV